MRSKREFREVSVVDEDNTRLLFTKASELSWSVFYPGIVELYLILLVIILILWCAELGVVLSPLQLFTIVSYFQLPYRSTASFGVSMH